MSINIDQKREDCVNLKEINTIIEDFVNDKDLIKQIKKYLLDEGAISKDVYKQQKGKYIFNILTKMYFIVNIDSTEIDPSIVTKCNNRIDTLNVIYEELAIGKVIRFMCKNVAFYNSIRNINAYNGFKNGYNDLLDYAINEYDIDAEHNNVQFDSLHDCAYNVNQHTTPRKLALSLLGRAFSNVLV